MVRDPVRASDPVGLVVGVVVLPFGAVVVAVVVGVGMPAVVTTPIVVDVDELDGEVLVDVVEEDALDVVVDDSLVDDVGIVEAVVDDIGTVVVVVVV